MSRFAAAIACVLFTGCVWGTRDSYHCDTDSDCNTGEAGRCELDHRCTVFDAACDTQRRYTAHSDELSDRCFDDRREPLNACASGQPPALPTGCFADVCAAEPACCATGWSEPCVIEAQLRCPELQCTTHLALTANKGAITELWDLTYGPVGWTGQPQAMRETVLVWLAPAPGTTRPRLASLFDEGRSVLVDDQRITVRPRTYQYMSSVDFDRDGRDTLALSSSDAMSSPVIELIKLDDDARREISTPATQRLMFADYDHDAFPDAFAFAGSNYHVIASIGESAAPRTLASITTNAIPTGMPNNTAGSSSVHGLEVADLDRDQQLDLIASGNTVRVHLGDPRIRDQPNLSIDCDPPVAPGGACDPTTTALTSAVVPSPASAALYVGLFPQRTLYRGVLSGTPPSIAFTEIAPIPCTGVCPGFIAMFARDLDGDQAIDVVAIDANLGFTTLRSKTGYQPEYAKPTATTTTGFTQLRTSLTGFTP